MVKMTKRELGNYRNYHIPGCSNINTVKVNAIFISAANSFEHEMKKCAVCYDLKSNGGNFITEAQRNKNDEKGSIRRVDVVDLTTGLEIEIETDVKRALRFKGEEGVLVIPVGWKKSDKRCKSETRN